MKRVRAKAMVPSTSRVLSLFEFMLLFEIRTFRLLSEDDHSIQAVVGWGEDEAISSEENQEIRWEFSSLESDSDLQRFRVRQLITFLRDRKLLEGDRILMERSVLLKSTAEAYGWTVMQGEQVCDDLLKMKVWMIDDGQTGDYFFVHF